MKRFATLFALLLAALALVACGSDSSTSGETSPAAGVAEEAEEKAEEAGEEVEEKAEEAEDKANEAKEDAEDGGSASSLEFEADPNGQLAYTEDEVTAEAGKTTITLTNSAPVPHDVRIESADGKDIGGTEVISESTESAKVDLKPGDYTFYCSVPGHRPAGMEGTLTVE